MQFCLVVAADLVLAVFNAVYQVEGYFADLLAVIFLLNTTFFGGMGIYYVITAGAVMRMLERASHMGGPMSNARVAHFSKNIQRVGVLLVLEFICLLVTSVLLLVLQGSGMPYYLGTTLSFALAAFFRSLQSLFLIISYRPKTSPKYNSESAE